MDGSPVHQNLVGWRSIDQKVDWMDDGLDGLDGYPFWVHPLGALGLDTLADPLKTFKSMDKRRKIYRSSLS